MIIPRLLSAIFFRYTLVAVLSPPFSPDAGVAPTSALFLVFDPAIFLIFGIIPFPGFFFYPLPFPPPPSATQFDAAAFPTE